MIPRWSLDDDTRRRLRQRAARVTRPALLGTLRRVAPLSERWGYDRGQPIDRFYIERFLDRHRRDIHGHVLEVKDTRYADRFGANVTCCDVIDVNSRNARATIVADLAHADAIRSDTFDCCIITQTLQFVYDVSAAVGHLWRGLKVGGVLLATVPAVSRIDPDLQLCDYWRFTPELCRHLFGTVFGQEQITVDGNGNALTSIAFLTGMAQEELSRGELEADHSGFPVVVTVRAVKRAHDPEAQG
jgi:hypothetical protein